MLGNQLLRYSSETLLCWDVESAHPSLNLRFARPWELSYALFTIKGGIQSLRTHLLRWPNMVITEDNPSFKHFDRARYERDAKDPREVYGEFGPLLRKHRSVFHNGLGFDSHIEGVWRREIGLQPDYSWLYSPGCIDTNCVSKAYRAQWTPDISSPEAFLAWQYRAQNARLAKGVKTRLGVMCGEFGIEYDPTKAHESEYDIGCNVALMQALAWKVEL